MATYRGIDINLTPTESMASNARRGLEWRREFGRGGTEVGVARARNLANRDELSPSTVRRMHSFFSRHAVDSQAEGFNSGEEGFPSAGRIAWELWGGDSGRTWAESKRNALERIDEEKSMKAIVTTGEAEGHVHTYDDAMDGGMTSPPVGEPDGHVHRFVMDDDGRIVIFMAEGHTHEPRETMQREEDYEKSMEKKFLTVPFHIESTKQREDEKLGIVKGYASTFNVDRGDDRIEPEAFDETLRSHKERGRAIRMLWQHSTNELIGGFPASKAYVDSKGLYVEGQINLETQRGREAYALAKQGVLSDFSIGFMIKQADYEKQDGKNIRVIKELELFEVSLVGEPMNQEAQFTEVKAVVPFQDLPLASREREWDSGMAVSRVRQFVGADEEPNAEYRRAFMYYDENNEDNFGAYKLPIADVIDGRLMAIPRAIFAVAGVLRGARGGVDIPQSEMAGVRSNVERYYRKMGLDSPFGEERGFRIDDISAHTERELEKLLKNGVVFTDSAAKTVISGVKAFERDVIASKQAERDAKLNKQLEEIHNLLRGKK